MKRSYLCPHCQARLNPNVKIILRAELDNQKGLFLFSPMPGNYDVILPEGFQIRKKDKVTFACPACGHTLTSAHDEALAEIRFISDSGSKGTVAFSRIYGHHATYFITAEQVQSYGEDADPTGINFWGVGPDT
jgi:uncharacterized protein YlaI